MRRHAPLRILTRTQPAKTSTISRIFNVMPAKAARKRAPRTAAGTRSRGPWTPAVPAKAGTHLPAARAAEKWTLAFARETFEEAGRPVVLAAGVNLPNERGIFPVSRRARVPYCGRNNKAKLGRGGFDSRRTQQNRGGTCSSKY